ncbi:hypothetical protein [Erythrobacter aurantius]|uniref:hypothetical protein n=1 Tax=Erythrobacter aurantius TaxID=2909249 RepID=UPI00207A5FDD|nr:hypothetical protein [Erythrobacter aurantius]
MSDNQPADNGAEDLRVVITNYGHLSPPSEVPEDLQPFLEQVRAMDPIRDARGNVQDNSGAPARASLTASALPPDLASEVQAQLARQSHLSASDRAAEEDRLVREIATARLGSIRGLTGVHPSSLPIHKAQAQIAMDVQELYAKRAQYQQGVDKIIDLRKQEDPETGELVAAPVYWLSAHTRQMWQEQIQGIDRDIRLLVEKNGLPGLIARNRLRAAELESAQILQRRAAKLSEEKEAKALASQMRREERIKRRAEQLATLDRD